VDLIIDASSVINLDNTQGLELVAGLEGRTLCLSPLVVSECQPTCAAELLRLQRAGLIRFVDPSEISAESFLELLEAHRLGEGETECLTLCLSASYVFCSDDNRARQVAVALIGAGRVVGSIRLLKWCVANGRITPEAAFTMYQKMKAAGGFLPELMLEWFLDADE